MHPVGVRHGEKSEAVTQVTMELLFRSERAVPGLRMHPVGADHQVEGASLPAHERHLHPGRALVQSLDRVPEPELDLVAHQLVQAGGQVASSHLQILTGHAAGDRVRAEHGDGGAVGIEERQVARIGLQPRELRKQTHAAHHLHGGTAHVDRISASAHRRCLLHHRDRESRALQPVRQRRSGNTRPTDQNRSHAWLPFVDPRTASNDRPATRPATTNPVTKADSLGSSVTGSVPAARIAPAT